MMLVKIVLNILVLVFRIGSSDQSTTTENQGAPLILTPMIKAGKIKEAQDACRNTPFLDGIVSYSGFFTVNDTYNSNIFFWFFPALKNNETAPILVFLEGGPGESTLYSLFLVNGPFYINDNLELKRRKYNWINSQSVIFIDNPVGTGFSFTNEGGYLTNEVEIGKSLYNATLQFFMLFPQFQKNDFFVTGESYGAKYVTSLSYQIYSMNPSSSLKINLKGLAIGNGIYDLEHEINYGDYLYQIGLLDNNGKSIFHDKENQIISYIQQRRWEEAFSVYDQLIFGNFVNKTIFYNLTGYTFLYNYLYSENYLDPSLITRYVTQSSVRTNLHVGNTTFNLKAMTVFKYLVPDFAKSVGNWVQILLENYRVLIYVGQLDILFPVSLQEQFLNSLTWSGSRDYQTAPRTQWRVERDLAGYSTVAKNLDFVFVRDAGHTVPTDQPRWAEDLITKFTRNMTI